MQFVPPSALTAILVRLADAQRSGNIVPCGVVYLVGLHSRVFAIRSGVRIGECAIGVLHVVDLRCIR